MSKGRIDILGALVDKLTMNEALNRLKVYLKESKPHAVYTPNSEIIMRAYRDENFRKVLNSADMVVADGIGVVYASRILKDPIKERVGGFDLSGLLIKEISDGSASLYFFGGKPGVAEQAKKKLCKKYPKLNICGVADGYFDAEKEKAIIADIKEKKPDIIFVCLGVPKQEEWIFAHKSELGVKVLMGIGGSLDVYAGIVERAPEAFQKLGLEWFYRLIKEPWRIGRMMDLPKFGFTVLLKGKRVEKPYEKRKEKTNG
ncbi:MAG: WecB/TagA/CpsF family glycosyltransferase [Clostridia bacterium]|nr:WecB/TagA/CpsF family glycosyltransferase [Clostridia bacterium]